MNKRPPLTRLIYNLNNRYSNLVKSYDFEMEKSPTEVLGISREELEVYIQKRFRDGMTWDNYGTHWVGDHILPISEIKSYDDLVRICHYTNLQPLLKTENHTKGTKITIEGEIKKYNPYFELDVKPKGMDDIDYFFKQLKKLKK
jgi:hypothetical protein